MKRLRPGPVNGNEPVIVRGASFTFRTLHSDPDWSRHARIFTLDRLMTCTLAAVPGLYHCEPATTEITL